MTATLSESSTGTPTTWALDHPNTYGETRQEAIERAQRYVAEMDDTVGTCEGGCSADADDARAALADVERGDVSQFSLDGIADESWTSRADSAESAASYAEDEHETFCLRD
jgi:hypothetical protein